MPNVEGDRAGEPPVGHPYGLPFGSLFFLRNDHAVMRRFRL